MVTTRASHVIYPRDWNIKKGFSTTARERRVAAGRDRLLRNRKNTASIHEGEVKRRGCSGSATRRRCGHLKNIRARRCGDPRDEKTRSAGSQQCRKHDEDTRNDATKRYSGADGYSFTRKALRACHGRLTFPLFMGVNSFAL